MQLYIQFRHADCRFRLGYGNSDKIASHGLTRDEVKALFATGLYVPPDALHSKVETRFLAIGVTPDDRHVFMAFTIRAIAGSLLIRPISARYMHKKEIDAHAKAIAQSCK